MLKRPTNPSWMRAGLPSPPRGTTLPRYAEDFALLVRGPRRLRIAGPFRAHRVLS